MADREIRAIRAHSGQAIGDRASGAERSGGFAGLHFDRERQAFGLSGIAPLFACAIGHRTRAVFSNIDCHDGFGPVGRQRHPLATRGTSPLHVKSPPTAAA